MKQTLKRLLYSGLPVPRFVRPVVRGAYRAGVAAVEGVAFLRKLLWVEPVLRSICRHVGHGLRAERLPYSRGPGDIVLGDRVNLSGRSCFYFIPGMPERPVIELGDEVFLGNACTLSAARRITVGAHSLISAEVRIHDNDGHPLDPARRRAHEPIAAEDARAVCIGANVWIGARATILKGVTIGSDAVVGAGAVVTGDVPAKTVVAGNPARVVGSV